MNKKFVIAGMAAFTLAFGAAARPHHGPGFGPRGFGGPVFHHHHHHGGFWGRGGRHFWPGFVGGVIGGAIYDAVTYPRYYGYGYGGVVVAPTPTVVTTPPVVVQQQPVVVQQPAPVVVQQPVAQNVWVEGRYVDQVQANGTVVRVWQPGHYVQSTAVVQ